MPRIDEDRLRERLMETFDELSDNETAMAMWAWLNAREHVDVMRAFRRWQSDTLLKAFYEDLGDAVRE